jgi:hypothetical protein
MPNETLKMRITDSHVFFVSGPFSQWSPSPFSARLPALDADVSQPSIIPSDKPVRFSHAEQAMMASKASLFGDTGILAKIMVATSPKEQKALGREVGNFHADVWNAVAYRIVCIMNFEKFAANPDLRAELLATGSRHIVEGAWYDKIWGVGLAWDDPAIDDPGNWKGTNWLGEALMAVRAELSGDGTANPWKVARFMRAPGS